MNKVELICNRIHRLNDNIQLGETDTYIKLILKGRIIDKQYKTVYEIVQNHLVAIETDNTRYIISDTGEIIDSWKYSENNIDEYYIGKYLDTVLNDNISISEIKSHKMIITKESNKTADVMLLIHDTAVDGTYIVLLYNFVTFNRIDRLMVNGKLYTKFIENNITKEIHIINKDIKYIRNYDIINNDKYIGGGIYNNDILISQADDYYSYLKDNNLVIIKINKDTFGIIYNNSLQENTYKFIGVKGKILYTQEKSSDTYILYNLLTLDTIDNIEGLNVSIENGYRVFDYKLNNKQYHNTVKSIVD